MWSYNVVHLKLTYYTLFCSCLVAQACPTLRDLMNYSPPGSSVHGFFQARGGLPFPSSGDLPDLGIEPASPTLAGGFSTSELPGKPIHYFTSIKNASEKVKATAYDLTGKLRSLEAPQSIHLPPLLPGPRHLWLRPGPLGKS